MSQLSFGSRRVAAPLALTLIAVGVCAPGRDAIAQASQAIVEEELVGEETVEADEPVPIAGYDRGFFVQSRDGDYLLRLNGRVQVRFTGLIPEDGGNESAFSVERARLTFSGHVFGDWMGYKVQIAYDRGVPTLKDYFVDIALGSPNVVLRLGQFKRAFSRQRIASTGSMDFVERAPTDRYFRDGRDIGLAIQNRFERSPTFEWVVALFNGTGDEIQLSGDVTVDPDTLEGEIESGRFTNVPDLFDPQLVARVGYNLGGIDGYTEGDLRGGPFRLAVGLGGRVDFDADDTDDSLMMGTLDAIMKLHGWSLYGSGFVWARQDGDRLRDQAYAAWGSFVQTSYMVSRLFQPAARYAHIDPDGESNNRDDVTLAVNLYFWGNEVKLQTDATAMFAEGPDGSALDWQLRSQFQLIF